MQYILRKFISWGVFDLPFGLKIRNGGVLK